MTTTLYVVALITLGVSFFKSKGKTILALKKAWMFTPFFCKLTVRIFFSFINLLSIKYPIT